MRHAAYPTHVPWFIAEPGHIDALLVLTALFVVLFTVSTGVLMLRILYLPAKMVRKVQKAKYEVVATLCLLALFDPGSNFWVAALLLAVTPIPDFISPLQRIDDALRRIAQSRKMKQEFLSRPERQPPTAEHFVSTSDIGNVGFGSKCEKLNVSKSSPIYPAKRTSMRGAHQFADGPCVDGSASDIRAELIPDRYRGGGTHGPRTRS